MSGTSTVSVLVTRHQCLKKMNCQKLARAEARIVFLVMGQLSQLRPAMWSGELSYWGLGKAPAKTDYGFEAHRIHLETVVFVKACIAGVYLTPITQHNDQLGWFAV